ncbi:amine oxidase, partial [Brevibacillus sp. SIMBA_076]
LEGLPELSFTAILREFLPLLDPNIVFHAIEGGNDRLPYAFVPELKENLNFRYEVTKIVQHDNRVTIHSKHTQSDRPLTVTGD